MKKIPLCPPFTKGDSIRRRFLHPHPTPLPSREREIMEVGFERLGSQ
jgi:hypothetical protein